MTFSKSEKLLGNVLGHFWDKIIFDLFKRLKSILPGT